MAALDTDTELQGSRGRYRGRLSPEWCAQGPFGGFVAALALRAIIRESRFQRPVSFACQFFRVGRLEPIELSVGTSHGGSRSQALRALLEQEKRRVAEANAWLCDDGLAGFDHRHAFVPEAPPPEELRSFEQLVDDYELWPSIFRRLEARPVEWRGSLGDFRPGPPQWRCWMRLREPVAEDRALQAATALLWLDFAMSQPVRLAHPWPLEYDPYNLDLTAHFHAALFDLRAKDWLLCDARSPEAADGLAASEARLWTRSGRLAATGSAQLLCRRTAGHPG